MTDARLELTKVALAGLLQHEAIALSASGTEGAVGRMAAMVADGAVKRLEDIAAERAVREAEVVAAYIAGCCGEPDPREPTRLCLRDDLDENRRHNGECQNGEWAW